MDSFYWRKVARLSWLGLVHGIWRNPGLFLPGTGFEAEFPSIP